MKVGDRVYCKKSYRNVFTFGKFYIIQDTIKNYDKLYIYLMSNKTTLFDRTSVGVIPFVINYDGINGIDDPICLQFNEYFVDMKGSRKIKLDKLSDI